MKAIPAHLLTDLASVRELHLKMEAAFDERDFKAIESFRDITNAFESYHISFINSAPIDSEQAARNQFLRSLLNNYSLGKSNVRIIPSESDINQNTDNWHKQFLFQFTVDVLSKLTLKDVPLSLKSIPKDWDRYFKLSNYTYKAGGPESDFNGWSSTSLDKLPIEAIIIVDPYFLSDWKKAEINLTEILNGLIGKRNPNNTFELSLFVKRDYNAKDFSQTKALNFSTLKTLVKSLYPKMKFDLSLFYIPESKMHDRYIFTNFYYIVSGAGFNIYNQNKKLSTQKSNNLDIHLITDLKSYQNYQKRLREVKSWVLGITFNSSEYSGSIPKKLFEAIET